MLINSCISLLTNIFHSGIIYLVKVKIRILPILIIILSGLIPATLSNAASSPLDLQFGDSGYVFANLGQDSIGRKIVQQDDGKLVVVGTSGGNWLIQRYFQDGSLDTSFGINGSVIKDFGNADDAVLTVLMQPNGQILVGGYSGPGIKWTVARFNNDGSIDTSFGENGYIISIQGVVRDMSLTTDGKIVAVGFGVGISNGNDDVYLERYSTSGVLDSGFGQGGKVALGVGSGNDRGNAMALQSDGRIIVFGDFNFGSSDSVFLARLNANGSLDDAFGNSGKVVDQYGFSNGARDVLVGADQKIIVGGAAIINGKSDSFIGRYNLDGSLDDTFGNGGKLIGSISINDDAVHTLQFDSSGNILAGGFIDSGVSGGIDFLLHKYDRDGVLDVEFGSGGYFVGTILDKNDAVADMFYGNSLFLIGYASGQAGVDLFLSKLDLQNNQLSVPSLKQTDPLWANDIYDSADLWAAAAPTMGRWGCAVTSAAMVLQYHNISNLPDGTPITPGTLNSYLASIPDGYHKNGLTNWVAIASMTKKAKSQNADFDYSALQYKKGGNDIAELKADIDNHIPSILEVGLAGGQHFVVGKGVYGDKIWINDPGFERNDLTAYGSEYVSTRRFVPSNTDLSYLVFDVDANVEMVLKDEFGNEVGDASLEAPISDPLGLVVNSLGQLRVVRHGEPPSGNFTLEVSSVDDSSYDLNGFLYDIGGEVKVIDVSGVVPGGGTDVYVISFNKQDVGQTNVNVPISSFESLLSDVVFLYNEGRITKKGSYNFLARKIEQAQKYYNSDRARSANLLDGVRQQLVEDKKRGIDEFVSQYLIEQITLLLNTF